MVWFMAPEASQLRQALPAQPLSMRISMAMRMGNIRAAMAGWRIFFLRMPMIWIAASLTSFATVMCFRLCPCWCCPWCFALLFSGFWRAKYSPAGPRFSKRAAHP